MTKFIISIAVIAAAVGLYVVLKPDEQRSIGDPVLSLSPSAAPTGSASADLLDGTYTLVAADSSMRWQGNRPFVKGYFDNGTVELSAGTTVVRGGAVASGSVTVNLTTIAATSTGKGPGTESMLSKHLKSADFFDVEKFPTAVFSLTKLSPGASGSYRAEGTLTLKGITNPVSFDASVTQNGDLLTMTAADIVLDRTQWQVKYGSGKFFKELVGDKLVGDTFKVSFTAVGSRTK